MYVPCPPVTCASCVGPAQLSSPSTEQEAAGAAATPVPGRSTCTSSFPTGAPATQVSWPHTPRTERWLRQAVPEGAVSHSIQVGTLVVLISTSGPQAPHPTPHPVRGQVVYGYTLVIAAPLFLCGQGRAVLLQPHGLSST